ncbi:MAG TPA: hypothetical protein VL282_08725 [Tepidisphaeraceae bacterium]|jgi:hypothetical protein|nr:hypothetical protein [Tepidisphaeraceae bacterium]
MSKISIDVPMHEIEQPAGPGDPQPVDPALVDAHRKTTYLSYEKYLRDRLAELDRDRPSQWQRDYSSAIAYERSIEPMRRRLQKMFGFWVDPADRGPLCTHSVESLRETDDFVARRMRLEILPGLETYAIEIEPKKSPKLGGLLVQHGYAGTPEMVCGFTRTANDNDYAYRSLGIRAARRGFHVVAVFHPFAYGTLSDVCDAKLPGFEHHSISYGRNRLNRLASMLGGTLFGLDMMASSRGVDLLLRASGLTPDRIGMYGLSQGGMSALYLPALDSRIHASVSAAYFNWRFVKLLGPTRATCYLDWTDEGQFFSDVVRCFSDCDVVSLICPRAFAVEAGLHDGAVDFEKAQAEFERARVHYDRLSLSNRVEFIGHAEGHVCATRRALDFLTENLASKS